MYTWFIKQVFCFYSRRILDNESFWMSLKSTFLALKKSGTSCPNWGGGEGEVIWTKSNRTATFFVKQYFTQCFAKKLCPCTCTLRCYLSNIYGKGKGNVWGQNIVWNKGKRAKIKAKPQTNRMPIFLDSWRMFGALPQGNINTSSEPCDVALIPDICQSLHHLIINARNERVSPSKRINFRKCSKGPLPPSFLENHVAIFFF